MIPDVYDLIERFWTAGDSVPAALALINSIVSLLAILSERLDFLAQVAQRERDPTVRRYAAELLAQMSSTPAVVHP